MKAPAVTVYDSSGNNCNGTLNGGVSWSSAGRYGNCLYFDGSTGYVSIPEGPWTNAAPVTYSFWYKRDGSTSNGAILDYYYSADCPGSFNYTSGDGSGWFSSMTRPTPSRKLPFADR